MSVLLYRTGNVTVKVSLFAACAVCTSAWIFNKDDFVSSLSL
jgi:hypothetical protein